MTRYFPSLEHNVDLIDGEPRISAVRVRFLIFDLDIENALPWFIRQIDANAGLLGPVYEREVEANLPKNQTIMLRSIWLTQSQAATLVDLFETDPKMRQAETQCLNQSFAAAAERIDAKRKKIADKAVSVSGVIAQAAERIGCSTSSVYTQVKERFGKTKDMPIDVEIDAIDWLNALSNKEDLKKE